MHANQLDGAPTRGTDLPSRRDVALGGLIRTVACLATDAVAAPQTPAIPTFQSGRYQFTIIQPERELPSVRLFRFGGGTIDLSSLRGRPILLNFWATWCPACRTELPILDRLYEAGRANLHVAAVSEDRSGRQTVEHFVEEQRIRALPIYLDPNGYVAHSDGDNIRNAPFALYGMPITYLITNSGRVIGYMPGAADWTTSAAISLVEYLRST